MRIRIVVANQGEAAFYDLESKQDTPRLKGRLSDPPVALTRSWMPGGLPAGLECKTTRRRQAGNRAPYPPPTQGDFSALNKAPSIASRVARRPVTCSMLIR